MVEADFPIGNMRNDVPVVGVPVLLRQQHFRVFSVRLVAYARLTEVVHVDLVTGFSQVHRNQVGERGT